MSQQLEPLNLKVTGSAQGLAAALGRGESEVAKFAKNVEAKLSNIQASIPSIEKIGASIATGFAGFKVFEAFKLASSAEQAAVAFEVLTGSVAESSKMLEQMRALAAATPLSFAGLQENAKVMLAFGVSVKDVIANLETLGDISGGDTEKMKSLTLAFSQSAAAGRLMGQDLLQMINAGFQPLEEISKKTGKSMFELKKEMEAGLISFDMVREAFIAATEEGGRFYKMMDKQATTLAGSIGITVDGIQQLSASMAAVFAPAVKDAVAQSTLLIDSMSKLKAVEVQSAVAIGASVAAFAAVASVAPRVVAAVGAITKSMSLLQAFSGPKGWITLGLSLSAAAGAAYAVDSAMNKYQASLGEATRKSIEANGAQNALAETAKVLEGAVSKAAIAMEKMAATGLSFGTASKVAADMAKLKADLQGAEKAAAALNAELARSAKVEGYAKTLNQLQNAKVIVDGLQEKLARGKLAGRESEALSSGQAAQLKEQLAIMADAQLKMAKLKQELGGNVGGRSAEAINKDLEVTRKLIADLKTESDSLGGSLEKNKGYWEAQAAAARKAFELPIEKAKAQMESLNEAVKQGGLEMDVYVRAAKSIKDEFTKAVEAKKELAKPVQFSAAVTKGSAADIQDRFRYRVSEAGQQQSKLQEEGNRILNRLDMGIQKLISKAGASPTASIA
jgi:tape measure domain-containing protein